MRIAREESKQKMLFPIAHDDPNHSPVTIFLQAVDSGILYSAAQEALPGDRKGLHPVKPSVLQLT